jgi:hypothetical protein
MLIDGHLRKDTTPEAVVPVLVIDVSEEEADKILLTLGPLASMAEAADAERIGSLLQTVRTDSLAVEELLRRTAGEQLWGLIHPQAEPPARTRANIREMLKQFSGGASGWRSEVNPNRRYRLIDVC